jgi:O-antigen ligase/tetratricopeptide (TPR) repeat protein
MGHSLVSAHGRSIGRLLLILYLALSPLIFCVHTSEAFEENKVAFLKLIAWTLTGVGLAAWVGGSFHLRKTIADLLGRNPISMGVGLFVVSAAFSTWFSISPLTSWRGAVETCGGLQTILGYGVLFLATRVLYRTVADGYELLVAIVFATAVVCAHAIVQIAGLDPIAWDGVSTFAAHIRPFASLAHANNLGAYLVMAIPFVVVFGRRAVQQRRWHVAAATTLLGFVAAGVVFVTLSRGAWLGLGVCLAVLVVGALFTKAWPTAVTLGGTVLLCTALGVFGTVSGWFGESFRDSVCERVVRVEDGSGRWQIWQSGWETFREHPVTGSGLDTFRLAFGPHRTGNYWRFEGDSTPGKAHNEFLHILATQGSLGGVAVLLLLGGLGVGAVRAWRICGPENRPLVTAVSASLAGFLVTNLTGFTVVSCGGLFVCCAALLSRWQEAASAPAAESSVPWGLRRWPLLAGVLVVLLYAVNMGLNTFWVCAALGGCGVGFTWPLIRGSTSRSEGRAAPTISLPAAPNRVGWLPRPAIAVATLALIVYTVWCPLAASLACAQGDRLLAENPQAARTHYERAVAWDSDRDVYHVKLNAAEQLCAREAASFTEQQNHFKQAREQMDQALALVPADPYHWANLARLLGEPDYRDPDNRRLAAAAWDRALEMDPKNIVFIAEAARHALGVGDRARARRLANHGVELYPDYAHFYAELGACSLADGRLTEAAQFLEISIHTDWHGNADDEARAYATLATCHLAMGHFEYARDLAKHSSALQPRWPTAALLLAEAQEGLGEYDNAYRTYQRVLTIAPQHPAAIAGMERLEHRVRVGSAEE